jgi:hypothetical protein
MTHFSTKNGTPTGLVDPSQILIPDRNRVGGIVPQSIQQQGKDRVAAPIVDPKTTAKLPQPRHASGRFLPRPKK